MVCRLTKLPIALFLLALASVSPAAAQEPNTPLTITKARIGFEGHYKAGYWTPVWLTVRAKQTIAGRLVLQSSDGDNVPVVYAGDGSPSVDLSEGAEQTALLYVRMGPQRGRLSAQLRDAESDKVLWSQSLFPLVPRPAMSTQELMLTIGPPVGLDDAIKSFRRPEETAIITARVDSAAQLPDRWWGYEGVDWIFLPTHSPEVFDALTPEQITALRQWVALGGRLVLSVGARGDKVLADDSPWRALAPGDFVEVRPIRDRSGLETAANVELPWDTEEFQEQRPKVTQLENIRGRAEIDEGGAATGHSLAIRAPHGLGHVLWLSFDLDAPAIAAWAGRPRIVGGLLQPWQFSTEEGRQARRSVQHLGYEDLSGQLRSALEQFPGVTVVSFTNVAVLVVAYLLLIGPADFLLFRRLGLPSYGTWLTFPFVALLFCGAAWYMDKAAHGTQTRLNQLEIVDIDATEGVVRGSSWHHVYSPRTQQINLALRPNADALPLAEQAAGWLVWQGLPGNGLGGLASRQVSLAQPDPYFVALPGNQPSVRQLPVQVSSSKSLSGRWRGTLREPVESSLSTDEFGLLQGEVVNPIGDDLQDCWVAFGDWMFPIGDLAKGGRATITGVSPLNLEGRLTQRKIVESKDMTTPWDQGSLDVTRIAQVMMFHDMTRGTSYTGLTHRYTGYLDLTPLLRDGRAILVARAASPAARLLDENGEPLSDEDATLRWTWYRVVLPVARPENK